MSDSASDDTLSANRRATVRSPRQGQRVAVVGDVYRFLATGAETGGKYATFEAIVGPGGGPPPHVHSREEESFYVLEGEITFRLGDQQIIAPAGTFLNMPVGSLHCFKNEAGSSARMLISVAPAGLDEMFLEVGHPVADDADTAPPVTQTDVEKLIATAPHYGIEIKLPGA
ncbi:MAG: cupin domain-containing protein [Pirellulales bacterium]